MDIGKCILTENRCYKAAKKMIPAGIVVHSTGANNPALKRYLYPDDGIIGENQYGNHWNRPQATACVHAFIGKDKNGVVRVYQTLPFNYKPWGCGRGENGSYNDSHIQFEICEDALVDESYFTKVYNLAVEFCAYICKTYRLSIDSIVSHAEAHRLGYASNHGDIDHWLKKFNINMDDFRASVKNFVSSGTENTSKYSAGLYKVKINRLNVYKGPGTQYDVICTIGKNTVLNVSKIENKAWGHIEALSGWCNISDVHCIKVKSSETYIVQRGDSLVKIAKMYGTTAEKLAEINNIENPNLIHVGQTIKLFDQSVQEKKYNVGDKVTVAGKLWSNRNGGNSVTVNRELYITAMYSTGTYPIAFSKTEGGGVLGFGNNEVIK